MTYGGYIGGYGSRFTLIHVLFILLIIVEQASINNKNVTLVLNGTTSFFVLNLGV